MIVRPVILFGDVLAMLAGLPADYFDCVVTSPPYWGLRNYGVEGQLGLEATLGEHIDKMVEVFRAVRRVLKAQGTVWLNYGDCYAAAPNGKSAAEYKAEGKDDRTFRDKPFSTVGPIYPPAAGNPFPHDVGRRGGGNAPTGPVRIDNGMGGSIGVDRSFHDAARAKAGGVLKPKDLCMIPNRLAIALQEDGWWVRSEIIWHKPNPMPESVYDRPTTSHEKVWLLTKSEDYYYNHAAIREPVTGGSHPRKAGPKSRENVDRVPRARKPVKTPAGWDTETGAHGTVHRKGRTPATNKDGGRISAGLKPGSRMGRNAGWRNEPGVGPKSPPHGSGNRANASFQAAVTDLVETRAARNVWTIAPKPFKKAHFATFPPRLAELCIKAGVPPTVCGLCQEAKDPAECGGLCSSLERVPGRVLDPFGGSGTVGVVAQRLGVEATLIDLNPEYIEMMRERLDEEMPSPVVKVAAE